MTADVATEKIGLVIDKRYRITDVLGRGGMGTVYRAEHVRLKRPIALKLLHPNYCAVPEISRRFEREAFAAGRLDHPNCVAVSDFGELDDGTLFMAMELVAGKSLGDLIDEEGPLPVPRALRIMRHVLRGLAHAHAAGIVHRDVKPDNVLLIEQDGDPDFAKILDFGIAKLQGEALEADGGERLTKLGVAFGTPTYISPEQAAGGDIDPRADLYSASCMLFEMVAGHPPFQHDDRLKLLSMHLAHRPPTLVEANPGLAGHPALQALVAKGMGKQREERFASAGEYLAALDRCLEAERPAPRAPTPEASDGPREITFTPMPMAIASPLPWWQERRWQYAMGGGAFALLLLIALAVGSSEGTVRSQTKTLREYTDTLREGETCAERRAAVLGLAKLGDRRAVPALRAARYRIRSGPAGDENTNFCLIEDVEAAIRTLNKR